MASFTPISQSQPLFNKIQFRPSIFPSKFSININPNFTGKSSSAGCRAATTAAEKPKKRYPGEVKGFVEEMRFVAMKLHTKDQSKEGEKKAEGPPVAKWDPTIDGYLRFLVDSKLVYDTLERIVQKAAFPEYAEFRNTGLERSESLAKDLEWFKEQGHAIPEPSSPGVSYANYLEELSEKDPQAFLCHFYNTYFAHTAGGRMIGKKVAEKILNNKELEFYKWNGNLSQLLQNVREKLNSVAESWTREEKDHCLEETEKSFKFSDRELGGLLRNFQSSFHGKLIFNRSFVGRDISIRRGSTGILASAVGKKVKKETVIPDPDYRIPIVLLGFAGGLVYTNNLLPAAPVGLLGLLLLVQTTRVRFVFDNEALEVKVGEQLEESGENVFVGGKNRWKYSTFVNWELWWPNFPVLVYFKETQTKPEGQVHFFPVIFDGKQLYDVMVERAGPSKTSGPKES